MFMTFALIVCLLGVVFSANIPEGNPEQTGPKAKKCRCVPDQWEGLLLSTDREFDLKSGQSGSAEIKLMIHYDYQNKRSAMIDAKTGNKAIADYGMGVKYIVRADGCQGMFSSDPMPRMCLPDEARLLGEHVVADNVDVATWLFHGPYNVSMRTTVIQKSCIPLTEEVYMARGDFSSLSSSMYVDVSLGIQDESVFAPPADCAVKPPRQRYYDMQQTHTADKRQSDSESLLQALKNRYYIFH